MQIRSYYLNEIFYVVFTTSLAFPRLICNIVIAHPKHFLTSINLQILIRLTCSTLLVNFTATKQHCLKIKFSVFLHGAVIVGLTQ